jgi:hypothetical protein
MASNSGDSSASGAQALSSQLPGKNPTDLFGVRVRVTLRLAVYRQSIRLGAKPRETHDHYFFEPKTYDDRPYVTSSMTRVGAVYNCFWPSPAQSFSGPSTPGLMIIFYCLRFEAPETWGPGPRIYTPQEQSDPVIPPGTGFPFLHSYDSKGYGGVIRTSLHTRSSTDSLLQLS